MKNKNTNELPPLLLNGEASSPAAMSETLYDNREEGRHNSRLVVNLETDYEIGYFSDGIEDKGDGVGIELYQEWDKVPNPEGDPDTGFHEELANDMQQHPDNQRLRILPCGGLEERLSSWNFSEELVKPLRNENGKLTRDGLRELGTLVAFDHLMHSD
jgi:hypothetical protein